MGTSDDSGGSSPAVLTTFEVAQPKVSPATLRLNASAGAPVKARLSYVAPGGHERPMTQLQGVTGNEVSLVAPGLELQWAFAAEADLAGERFIDKVLLRVEVGGVVPDGGELELGLGNDAPEIEQVLVPTSEAAGNVGIDLRLRDSSADLVTLTAEWRRASEPPDTWHAATAAGVFPESIATQPGGVDLTFFWDTATDLGTTEQDVIVRFTPDDGTLDGAVPVGIGEPREGALHVDNNAVPIVQIDEGTFLVNEDQRRGIPLPYGVIDAEGDPVRVVFQWRSEGEADFPDLGTTDVDELAVLLRDQDFLREKQVCSPYARFGRGRIGPIDSTHARLPELLSEESWLRRGGVEGLGLELLRPITRPVRLGPSWAANPLQRPVAALPGRDGLTALVLDAGSASLVELELATGVLARTIAGSWLGEATAMAYTRDRRGVLIALHGPPGGTRLVSVDLAGETFVQRIDTTDGLPNEPIRGLVALSARTALASAGDSLWKLEWIRSQEPRAHPIATGLAEPWGLALDPTDDERVFVAEHAAVVPGGAGRLVSVQVATGSIEPVVASSPVPGRPAFPEPTALAFQPGRRLVALCSDGPGERELRGLIHGRTPAETFSLGHVPREATTLACGEAALTLLALPDASDLVVDGGIEQRRTLAAFDPASAEVQVTAPFEPAPRRQQAWRMRQHDPFFQPLRGSQGGEQRSFVWDSSEVAGGGQVRLRASCFDSEAGVRSSTNVGRPLRSALQVDPLVLQLGINVDIEAVIPADLDADGDLDLVTADPLTDTLRLFYQESPLSYSAPVSFGGSFDERAEHVALDLDGNGLLDLAFSNVLSSNLTVSLQETPGSFAAPFVLGGPGITREARGLVVADLDGDGRLDLASANSGSNNLTLFFQLAPGSFSSPLVLGGPGITQAPIDLAAADLDADGDLDLVAADSPNLELFFQVAPGSFALPRALGGPGTTDNPTAVKAADIDADGDMDLACTGHTLTVFLQVAPGNFADPRVLAVASRRFVDRLEVIDLDSDGDLDLQCFDVGFNTSRVVALLQGAPGLFSTPLEFAEEAGVPREIVLDDLDGNGLVDLASSTAGDLDIYYQFAAGSFSAPSGSGSALVTSPMSSADLDGDGDLDLMRGDLLNEGLSIYSQSSPGLLATAQVLPGPGLFDRLRHVATTDLEGDGDLDLVSAHSFGSSDPSVFIYVQSVGAYSRTIELTPPGFPRTLLPADFDADGLTDLHLGVVPGSGLSERLIYFQGPAGVFSAPVFIGGNENPIASEVADLDADGDLDLVTANTSSSDLTVYFQSGIRAFDAQLRLGGPGITDSPVALEAADLDRDGDVDLVCANASGSWMSLFLQDSPGTFAAPLAIGGDATGTIAGGQLEAIDLDADEDLDLVSSSVSGSDSKLLIQSASGFITAPVTLGGPGPFVVADVNGDGALDIAQSGSEMQVWFQQSPGSFSSPLSLGGTAGDDVAVADLDADGDLDLVSAGIDGATCFLQLAPGRFSSPIELGGEQFVKAADLDADGDVDLVVNSSDDGQDNQLVVLWGGR